MRVTFKIPPEARGVFKGVNVKTGQTVSYSTDDFDQFTVEVEPFFLHAKATAEILMGEVSAVRRGRVDQFTLGVMGGTGKLVRKPDAKPRRASSAVPAIDTLPPLASAVAAATAAPPKEQK
jgi:hypothetical protein